MHNRKVLEPENHILNHPRARIVTNARNFDLKIINY